MKKKETYYFAQYFGIMKKKRIPSIQRNIHSFVVVVFVYAPRSPSPFLFGLFLVGFFFFGLVCFVVFCCCCLCCCLFLLGCLVVLLCFVVIIVWRITLCIC